MAPLRFLALMAKQLLEFSGYNQPKLLGCCNIIIAPTYRPTYKPYNTLTRKPTGPSFSPSFHPTNPTYYPTYRPTYSPTKWIDLPLFTIIIVFSFLFLVVFCSCCINFACWWFYERQHVQVVVV